jgi:hypothetical protein
MDLTGTKRVLPLLTAILDDDRLAPFPQNDVPWERLIAFANRHRLTAALYLALKASTIAARPPQHVEKYLALIYRLNRQRNAALRRQALDLSEALNRVGIAPVLLKGAATLFDGPYADDGVRLMTDIDVLIEAQVRDRALAALQALGYGILRRYPDTHSAFGDLTRNGEPGAVDLHLEPIDSPHLLHAGEIRARARPLRRDGAEFLVPSRTDRALHNILHAEVHHLGAYYLGRLPLRDAHELAAMSKAFGETIDWQFVQNRMQRHGMTTILQSYVLAACRLFGARWPFAAGPSAGALVHFHRSLVQLRRGWLEIMGAPWGNLRGAFARHRMEALYGSTNAPLVARQARHAILYLRNHAPSIALARLLRL